MSWGPQTLLLAEGGALVGEFGEGWRDGTPAALEGAHEVPGELGVFWAHQQRVGRALLACISGECPCEDEAVRGS